MDQFPPSQPPPPSPEPHRTPLAAPPVISLEPRKRGVSVAWKILALVCLALLCVVFLNRLMHFSRTFAPRANYTIPDHNRSLEEFTLEQTNGNNKIAVVSITGIIMNREVERSSMHLVEFVREQLKEAQRDSEVKAVVLKVNSPGGEVLASDEINVAIRKFQDESHKPVVVSMETLAASGGYYISAPCQWIVANELTITGSIGVIMDAWNYRELMDKIGVRPHVFKSGRFKDMLSGEREPDTNKLSADELKNRQEENQMVQTFINETYGKFKDVVRSGRAQAAFKNSGKGKTLAADWESYADGRILSGKHAYDLGFVDELGDFQTAVNRAETLAGIPHASLVEYRVPFDFGSVFSHILGKSDVPAIKLDLGIPTAQLQPGCPYYILPTVIPQ